MKSRNRNKKSHNITFKRNHIFDCRFSLIGILMEPVFGGFQGVDVKLLTIEKESVATDNNIVLTILVSLPLVAVAFISIYFYIASQTHNKYMTHIEYIDKTRIRQLFIAPIFGRKIINLSLALSTCIFIYSLMILEFFDKKISTFQMGAIVTNNEYQRVTATTENLLRYIQESVAFLRNNLSGSSAVHFQPSMQIAIDGLSLFFVLLTTFLIFICFLAAYQSVTTHVFSLCIVLFLIEEALLLSFLTLDLFVFYISFESVLIPMYFLIGRWGRFRPRKIKANFYFFLYTLTGSMLILFAIVTIYTATGTTNIIDLMYIYAVQGKCLMTFKLEARVWWFLIIGFGIKIPMIPLHLWLPEAHVEAPTIGSILLAGLLLKLGGYGIIRFVFMLMPHMTMFYQVHVVFFALLGAVYGSLLALAQDDVKKIIAYSSVTHMNFGLMGLFTLTYEGIIAFVLLMIGHGIISSGLFFSVGCLYDRQHTRDIKQYGGVYNVMPLFSIFLTIFCLSNIAFPGTVNFISEILVLFMITRQSPMVAYISSIAIILNTVYSLLLLTRICFGTLRVHKFSNFYDLTITEFLILLAFAAIIILTGFFPGFLVDYMSSSMHRLYNIFHEIVLKGSGYKSVLGNGMFDSILGEILKNDEFGSLINNNSTYDDEEWDGS